MRYLRWLITAALVFATPFAASAACDCGSANSNATCTGTTTGNYSVGSKTFRWDFNCGGRACKCGQFINGEFWVVPQNDLGQDTGTVSVTGIGANGGVELNTPGGANNLRQSQLPSEANYDSSKNLRGRLPLQLNPSSTAQSLITSDIGSDGCAKGNFTNCVRRASVLTVLDSVPPAAGSQTFRPPWAGTYKPLYQWSQVRTDILPKMQIINNSPTEPGASLDSIESNFAGALYDKCGGLSGLVRMCLSDFATDGSDFAERTHGAILTLMGNHTDAQKRKPLINFLQQGIDRYGLWKIGNWFPPGAGQNVGRYAPLGFAATMIQDPTLKADVTNIGHRGENDPDEHQPWMLGHNEFDLFGHIRISTRSSAPGGVIAAHTPDLWSDVKSCTSDTLYWNLRSGGGTKDCGDWYGYLDMGPKGIPQSYMICCWTNPAAGLAAAMWGFPQLRLQINYEPFITYVNRFKGTLPNSSFQGTWAHGPCSAQQPPAGSTDCIKTSSVNSPDARHPGDHGKPMATTGNIITPEREVYGAFRRCEENPSTPGCAGYRSPFCGDGVCDARGIYSRETNSSCPADCDTSAVCGNGTLEVGEQCDGGDFGGRTCATEGAGGGNLSCSSTCTLDTSTCNGPSASLSVNATPASGFAPLTVTLTAVSNATSPIYSWECDGDGDFNDTCGSNPSANSCVCPTLTSSGVFELGARIESEDVEATDTVDATSNEPQVLSLTMWRDLGPEGCANPPDGQSYDELFVQMGPNEVVRRDEHPCNCFGIEANDNAATRSVEFVHTDPSGNQTRLCENAAPRAFKLAEGQNMCTPELDENGTHRLVVTPFAGTGCSGQSGAPFSRTWQMQGQGTPAAAPLPPLLLDVQ